MHVNKKMSFESLKPSHIIIVGGAGGVAWWWIAKEKRAVWMQKSSKQQRPGFVNSTMELKIYFVR